MQYEFSHNLRVNRTLNEVINMISMMAEDQLKHIQQLTKIGESLSSEKDLDKIFDMILEEGIAFTKSDGATIYKVNEDATALEFEIIFNATLNMRQGGSHGKVDWPPIPLYEEDGKPKLSHIVSAVYHTKHSLVFDDVYQAKGYDISGTINFDKSTNYRCKAMLTIPLKDHEDTVLGVIQFINPLDEDGQVTSFNPEHKAMLSSLASQAAIALSNRRLISNLEELLLEFMRSIAGAIERKSKYSSAHITRVARLTEMMAERINQESEGVFADVQFSEDELKEISMAGWMHDVGKIITPEFVMDKSTKLERTIDGIEIIMQRITTVKTFLLYIKQKLGKDGFNEFCQKHFPSPMQEQPFVYLDQSASFIQALNIGTECVSDEDIARIHEIASINVHYNDMDYYIIDDSDVQNLSIRKGTLNPEEIKTMRDHASITWEMLSQLSFPKKYKNVPYYAATHHEALDGKGYPRGLNEHDLPLQSRIIAIADIFEALTSSDRPYKSPQSLSESLHIMANMVKSGHLDGNLVDFFMDSGLYLTYAHQFMKPAQIDHPDIIEIKSIYHYD